MNIEAVKNSSEKKKTGLFIEWINSIKDRFLKLYDLEIQEKHIELPPIDIRIHFGAHGTREDAMNFEKELEEADVYFPESLGWDTAELVAFKKFTEGKMSQETLERFMAKVTPREYVGVGFEKQLFKMLYQTRKPVAFIDLPEGHPIQKELKFLKFNNFSEKSKSFEELLDSMKDYAKKVAELQLKREEYMQSQIVPQLERLCAENPELAKKKTIRILMSLGSAHTTLYHVLKKEGQPVTRSFPDDPYVQSLFNELVRRYELGKPVNDEIVAGTFLESWLSGLLFDKGFSISKTATTRFIRDIALKFSVNDIKDLLDPKSFKLPPDFKNKILQQLKEKNIELPSSQEELDKLY
jgi:hypothetical protein